MSETEPNKPNEAETPQPAESPGPLAGLHVLELGEMVAAPYCAKLLADLGARVVKVENPEGGDPSRWRGPFPGSEPDPERSGLFLYLNTSKRSVRLDLGRAEDRESFASLAARADILIEDRAPGALAAMQLGYESLAAHNAGLVVTSITPFGQTGPNSQHHSRHLNLYHSAGHASPFSALDVADRAPSRAGGYLGEYDAGLTAAVGTLAAICGREASGRGQHIDVSKQEAMMCLERVTIGRFANEENPFSGRGPGGLTRAKDGWLMLTTLEAHQWEGLLRAMGQPEWAEAEWCQTQAGRMQNQARIKQHLDAWAGTLTREEIYHRAQAEGTPAGPVRDVAELLAWEQAHSRGFFRDLEHGEAGPLRFPTAPYRFSRTSWAGTRPPRLGEHDEEVLGALTAPSPGTRSFEASPAASRTRATPSASDVGEGPLAGLRVADFTWAWAGPQGSLLLSMLGAEVIKIESRARIDHSRVHSLTAGSLSGGIDGSPVFNDLNLGKRSLTLNLKTEKARDLVRQLVAESDIVLQNMRPGVLDRMGLGYEELSAVKPNLIMLSSSAVGATGPEGSYAGYAPTFACLSGIVSISGHPDEPPIALSGSVDLRVGTASAFAVLAALTHRQRTGEGQNIDLSSTEVMSSMMGDAIVGYELSGVLPVRLGNRDEKMAPHGCYPCRGDAEWITIAVGDETEWRALCSLMGDPQLEEARFATAKSRKQHEDRLDERIEQWTRGLAPSEAVELLQGAGIAAARLQTGASLSRDPHLLERNVYQPITHPRLGERKVVRPPWRLEGARIRGSSPLLGQDNEYVLGEILGLPAETIAQLVEDEIVY